MNTNNTIILGEKQIPALFKELAHLLPDPETNQAPATEHLFQELQSVVSRNAVAEYQSRRRA